MGQSEAAHSIRNRHFTSLSLKEPESVQKSRLVGTVAVSSQAQLEQWKKGFQEMKKEENIHMLLPLQWRIAHASLCGSSKLIELYYEPYPRLLSEEAQLRSQQNRHLQESQIWYIVWAVAEVAERCGKNGQRLSDISLDNIFMNATGNVKILTPYSLPDSQDPYFEPNVVDVYFSPEELKCRQLGQMYNDTDIIKSSSFATGMLLLSLSLLKPLHYLYDYNKNTIDTQKLIQEINNLQKIQHLSSEFNIFRQYSENYQKLLRKLLEIDHAQRVTVIQVREQLQPHLENIANLKSFQFQVPQPPAVSPNRSIKKQPTIVLGSYKLKRQSTNQSPPSGTEAKTIKREEDSPTPVALPPLIQSKYLNGSAQLKDLGSGIDLLRKIDEKLMRSRQEFPS